MNFTGLRMLTSNYRIRSPLGGASFATLLLALAPALLECGANNGGGGGSAGIGAGGSAGSQGSGVGGTAGSGGSGGSAANPGFGGSSTTTGGAAGSGGVAGGGGSAGNQGAGGAAGSPGAAVDGGTVRDGGTTGADASRDGSADVGATPEAGAEAGPTRPVAGLAEYWIAPTGSDTNPGTLARPFFTLVAAVTYAGPGSTIWVEPGTYHYANIVQLAKSGTSTAHINITAVPGGARPLIDFSLQRLGTTLNATLRGFDISGDYWHITGIDIQDAADNCINIGGSNNTIENVKVHGCGDTGIQITVEGALAGDPTKGANNTILNCDSYANFDPAGPSNNNSAGENADGFACKLAIGAGNVFRGCRAWNNADDGWDFFAANNPVVIDNCWAFLNGITLGGLSNPAGDGNGFKLGGRQTGTDLGGAIHQVTNAYAFENLACGFTRNNNSMVPVLTSSGSRNNQGDEYCPSATATDFTIRTPNDGFTMRAADAITTPRNADGSLPAIH